MKKNIFGRKFSRDVNERKALFKGLLSSLVLHGRIKTTEQKAKAIKKDADKLITKVKKHKEDARRLLGIYLNEDAIKKLIKEVAPRFEDRNGGYTRIIRLGRRFTDSASMAIMEWVDYESTKINVSTSPTKQGEQNSKLEEEKKSDKKSVEGKKEKKKEEKKELKTEKKKVVKLKEKKENKK